MAVHLLGDDLSLISRQRDQATNGLVVYAADHPQLRFRELLDGFNEQWVHPAAFFSTAVLVELLESSGRWTADYYRSVDPDGLGESVGFFGATGPSPWWQVSAREYVERWIHHQQIRRAIGRPDLGDTQSAPAIAAVVVALGARIPELGSFVIGARTWEFRSTDRGVHLEAAVATPVLSRALSLDRTRDALTGDRQLADVVAAQTCRDG